ncbi:MAG: Hsp20/alpha crystallin family protein [Cyanobacteria bacterium P01_G01_bin.67]
MTIIRYTPWLEIDTLERQLNHMFNEVLAPNSLAKSNNYSTYPAAELIETKEALLLKLEVPGMQPSEIEIEATAKSISLKGNRQSEIEDYESKTTLSEFRYGSFQREISLPRRIKNTEINGEFKDGILHLTLPKADEEINKVIKVNLPE